MRRLRWTYGLIAALLLAILAYTGVWFHLKSRMAQGLADWAQERTARGWQVAFAAPEVSGFPYRLVLDLRDIALADPTHPQAWALKLPAVKVVTHPWTLRHLIILPQGPLDLAWGPASARSRFQLAASEAKASLVLDSRERPLRLDAEGRNGQLDLAFPRFDGRFLVKVGQAELHARDNRGQPLQQQPSPQPGPPTAVDVAVTLQDFATTAVNPGPPFGPNLALLSFDLGLTGRLDGGTVARWRDDGGTLELRKAALRWGPLDATTTGTLALDSRMRLIGALTAEAKGWDAVIDRLADSQRLARNQARALKLALGLLSRPTPDGGKLLKAPITAQDGRLYVGPAAVLDLPSLPLE